MSFSTRTVVSQSALFAIVLFNSVTMLLSAGGSLFGTLEGFNHGYVYPYFVFPTLAALLVCGIVIMLATHWGIIANESTRRQMALAFAVIGAVCFTGMVTTPQSTAIVCAAVTGIACAISYLLQLMAWGARLSHAGIKQALTIVSTSAAIAAIAALVIFSFSNSIVMAASFCITLIGGGITAAIRQQDEPEQGLDAAAVHKGFELNTKLWPLFAGALLCMFVLLLMWTGPGTGQAYPHSDIITRSEFVGFICCALALAVISAMHPDGETLKRSLVHLCPLFAVLPIVPCVTTAGSILPLIMTNGLVSGVGFAYFMAVPIAAFCVESGFDKDTQGTWGAASVAVAIGGVAGVTCASVADGSFTTPATLSLFIIYLVACALAGPSQTTRTPQDAGSQGAARQSSDATAEPDGEAAADASAKKPDVLSSQDSFAAHCADLAQQWGLTPRESEVLPLLAQGRSQPSIARELYCSPETVKVHVRHIYEKSGIRSKEALVEQVQATWHE